ncbi:unnamed protein product [Periconia digitata]|uniref:MYND-type zinc finger protein samB n=1 Tax=Periconia digitata TaxID=1303443 RepID=A0A9W4U6E8_9PLEO|nr:unnamed protein product [Periconia digitata]
MKCAGCLDAPVYPPEERVDTVYCNRDCQKVHWSVHKAHCRTLGSRKKLLRVAVILKVALLTYREVRYDIDLRRIAVHDGVLCLYQNQRPATTRCRRGRFPAHLTSNNAHREAALANNQCTTAMALLGRLTRKLLKGVTSTINILDVQIGKPTTRTKLVPGPDASNCPHTVLKVKLSGNEAWIIDTAGCQYGFEEVLVPFETYMTEKSCTIASAPAPYDATETKDLDYFSTLPFMNKTKAQRGDREQERRARMHFAEFVSIHVSRDIINGSVAEFERNCDRFARDLTAHMLALT